jgi:hypothetical protein
MKKNIKTMLSIFLLSSIIIASGCTAFGGQNAATSAPTLDLNAVKTEVASTVEARITYDAALTQAAAPSETPVPPTNTSVPPTAAVPATEIITQTPVTPALSFTPTKTPGSSTSGSYPTFTPTFYPDRAELVAKNVPNGVNFAPNAEFDIVWTVKNTGVRAWDNQFYIKYTWGVEGSDSSIYHLPGAVAVGSTVDLRVDMLAPSTPGSYSTTWSLINNDGVTIYTLFLNFNVN